VRNLKKKGAKCMSKDIELGEHLECKVKDDLDGVEISVSGNNYPQSVYLDLIEVKGLISFLNNMFGEFVYKLSVIDKYTNEEDYVRGIYLTKEKANEIIKNEIDEYEKDNKYLKIEEIEYKNL
jgi:hypothetical protein